VSTIAARTITTPNGTNQNVEVTVAICTWNRAEPLRETLEQFTRLELDSRVTWELIVVNNNSTDHTDAVVESFADRLPIRLPQDVEPGQSRARTLAIQAARGRIIAWTDDDVLVEPNWLTALLAAFAEFDAEWVFGPSLAKWPGFRPSWYSDRFANLFAQLDYGPSPFVVTNYEQSFFGLNHAGTRDAHMRLGGYRTEFGFKGTGGGVGEDVDMFYRALAAGMKIVYTPAALLHHVIPEARTRKRYHRNRVWVSHEVVFKYLPEMFPDVPMLLGMPRFLFGKAAQDAGQYLRAVVTGRRPDVFHYELQLLRFGRLLLEAARHGFRAPGIASPAAPSAQV